MSQDSDPGSPSRAEATLRGLLARYRRGELRIEARDVDTSLSDDADSMVTSYRIVGAVNGHLGGRLKLVQKNSGTESWFNPARAETTGDAFQGDPSWCSTLWGELVSVVFGLVAVSESLRTLPDATEVNQAITLLNTVSAPDAQIAMRYYEPPVENTVSDVEYATRFVRDGVLPVAKRTEEAAHDVNYHLPAILLPGVVLRRTRETGRPLIALRDWVESRLAESLAPDGRSLISHVDDAIDSWAEGMDEITGAPQVALNPRMPLHISEADSHDDVFDFWCSRHFADGITPQTTFRQHSASLRGVGPQTASLLAEFEAAYQKGDCSYTRPMPFSRHWIKGETLARASRLRETVRRLAEAES